MLLILVNALIIGRMLYMSADSYAGDIDYYRFEGSSMGHSIPRDVAIDSLERARADRLQHYHDNIEFATELNEQEAAIAENDSFTAEAVEGQVAATEAVGDVAVVEVEDAGNDEVAGDEVVGGDDVGDDVVTGIVTDPGPATKGLRSAVPDPI